jgi:hypothetical protein
MSSNLEFSEVGILERLLTNGKKMSVRQAQYFLSLGFSDDDAARMHQLAERNQEGDLLAAEKDELIGYAKAGCLLGILQSKARKFLKTHGKLKAS